MATIQARPSRHGRPHYRVQIRLQGMYRSATFATLADARQWAYVTEGTLRTQRSFPTLEAALWRKSWKRKSVICAACRACAQA